MVKSNDRKISLVKDIVIPIIGLFIAFVGLYANYSANKRQELAANADREQKYLDFFLQNYSDSSSTKQATAFLLLRYINPDVQKDLIYSLSFNTNLSPETYKTLLSYKAKLNFGEANNYLIEIYYAKEYDHKAKLIKSQLDSAGFKGHITVDEKIPKFWDNYGWGHGNSIRYYPSEDGAAMAYLFRFINFKNEDLKLSSEKVNDNTRPKSIAIHLPPKVHFLLRR